jgi:hypothetical protein
MQLQKVRECKYGAKQKSGLLQNALCILQQPRAHRTPFEIGVFSTWYYNG